MASDKPSIAIIGAGNMEAAFLRYEATRKERTSLIQHNSHINKWMSQPTDPDWVYRYDAWREPLREPAQEPSKIGNVL